VVVLMGIKHHSVGYRETYSDEENETNELFHAFIIA
jgi:hypothetical protein